jgi:hypothetical protein
MWARIVMSDATDVGVVDDERALARVGPDRPALAPVPGIGDGLLVGPLGDGETFDPHRHPGGVHHREHVAHTLVLLAHQRADGAARRDDTGGGGMDAQLVLERDDLVAVPLATLENLGTMNSEIPLVPGAASGSAGEHQVDDVVGEVLVAPGDEDLLAGEARRCRHPWGPLWWRGRRRRSRRAAR